MSKKYNIKKLLINISIASSIALCIFVFIYFLRTSTFTSTGLKSYIDMQFSRLTLSIFLLEIFSVALILLYRGDKIRENLAILGQRFGEIYDEKIPFIIIGMGCLLLFSIFLTVINLGFKSTGNPNPITLPPKEFTITVLGVLSIFMIIIGIALLIVSLYAKISLESKKYFTRLSGWIHRNRDMVAMIVSIITLILAFLQYQK